MPRDPIVVTQSSEYLRLQERDFRNERLWLDWGPYLSERQWGTVREDYSATGEAWRYFPHDMARSRAYRWGEDGIGGISDHEQRMCFALAFWNGNDAILKERYFGLDNHQGNHGEDVKEYYYYLDSTPTHSYMRMLYKYPQAAFPYTLLEQRNALIGPHSPEYELVDTGVFKEDRYFDISIEYAKGSPVDILIRIEAINRGPEPAPLYILPHLWFRNTWSWCSGKVKPEVRAEFDCLRAEHPELGNWNLFYQQDPIPLFTENDTNLRRLFGIDRGRYFKDAFHEYVVEGNHQAVNSEQRGTKAALMYRAVIGPGEALTVRLRLYRGHHEDTFGNFDSLVQQRRSEADEFYGGLFPDLHDPQLWQIQRQALAGLLWSKQFYYYNIEQWLEGDPFQPPPPPERKHGRNHEWKHLNNSDILSMPDKWEYPWYAAWDLAFHTLPLAQVDAEFAKRQLDVLTREWYMDPRGTIPAYEWAFSDVNPPVHAWATWRVYKIDEKRRGIGDLVFLERVFHKLMINFTWWVNRKDREGHNIFQGGFLGLDNIGVFDRSKPLPTGGYLSQADGTSWMAMYCLNLLRIALELAKQNPVYEDVATKFFEHFLYIARAMTNMGDRGIGLWDPEDEFYYDVLHLENGQTSPVRLRSLVGLAPLFAVETLEPEELEQVPTFRGRLEWLLENKPELAALVSRWEEPGVGERRLLSLLRGHRMKRLLRRMLDETEFLSPYGVRSLSKVYGEHPFTFEANGCRLGVDYEPGESACGLFGGNSNWRGPVWMPVNYLLIESLEKFHHYYGDDFKVECPTNSGQCLTIQEVAAELARRLIHLYLPDKSGSRPAHSQYEKLDKDPHFRDHLQFFEYFHGDNGRGAGASHQTGWTALIAKLILRYGW